MTRPPDRVARFTPTERITHRAVATLGLLLTASGLVLYVPSLSVLVARRPVVEGLHVAAGLLLPLPVLAALSSAAFRADLALLNRFDHADRAWLRRRARPAASRQTGKFNAGQKLASAAFAAAGVVLFGTGLMLLLPTQLRLTDGLREGATLVHDGTTMALVALLIGHARLAYRHPEARAALRTGAMDLGYAREHHGAWAGTTGRAADPEPAVRGAPPARPSRPVGPPRTKTGGAGTIGHDLGAGVVADGGRLPGVAALVRRLGRRRGR